MHLLDVLLLAGLGLWLVLALRSMRRHKGGCNGCCGNCAACTHACAHSTAPSPADKP